MSGSTKTYDTTPKTTQQLRDPVKDYLLNPAAGGLNRVNATPVAGPNAAQVSGTPNMVGQTVQQTSNFNPVNIAGAQPVSTQFNSGADISRGQVRDVGGSNVAAQNVSTQGTQSVDQLGGANSAFFNNMVGQLNPMFNQQRSEGLAAAKESAGTLTGSGFANRLGSSINRSLGNQQATLANYASQGLQTEVGRQQSDASRFLQAAGMNQSANLQAGMANQSNSLQAQMANQGADQGFMQAQLARNAQGLQAQGMQSQEGMFNAGNQQQTQLANQAATNQAGMQNQQNQFQTNMQNAQFGQQAALQNNQNQYGNNQFNAAAQNQANNLGYQGNLQTSQQNANNFMQLLGQQASLGAGPTTIVQKPGALQTLAPIAGAALGSFLGPIGTAVGSQIGKRVGGG